MFSFHVFITKWFNVSNWHLAWQKDVCLTLTYRHIQSVTHNLLSLLENICLKQLGLMRQGCLCHVLFDYKSNLSHKSCDLLWPWVCFFFFMNTVTHIPIIRCRIFCLVFVLDQWLSRTEISRNQRSTVIFKRLMSCPSMWQVDSTEV